ncbi:hypothetical protein NDU88_003887 [Pleurodeles waltl]|uniref:Uncharacterized protein n=1 Tax=Pleurodeles waltl TaxID=8319 RepID=A0AAV7QB00_PLEWA|nr:hypothetical protein NDU88_003887 [Pleurodeles waltl]
MEEDAQKTTERHSVTPRGRLRTDDTGRKRTAGRLSVTESHRGYRVQETGCELERRVSVARKKGGVTPGEQDKVTPRKVDYKSNISKRAFADLFRVFDISKMGEKEPERHLP